MSSHKIKSKLISNHKFNEKRNLSKIIQLLKKNLVISIISDAGTPCISDPGSEIIKECIKQKIAINSLPGPSASITAMSVSGFSEKFFFYGFFPEKNKNLNEDLKSLSDLNSCIVFFISAKKINKAIPSIKKNFTGRQILICREMTKLYEELIRLEVENLNPFYPVLKGELTIVISEKKFVKNDSQNLSESDKRIINQMINKISIKEIINLINSNKKIKKKEIYNYCLKIKK